jgi:hypothetical protein
MAAAAEVGDELAAVRHRRALLHGETLVHTSEDLDALFRRLAAQVRLDSPGGDDERSRERAFSAWR